MLHNCFLLFPNPNSPDNTPFLITAGGEETVRESPFAEIGSIAFERRREGSACTTTDSSLGDCSIDDKAIGFKGCFKGASNGGAEGGFEGGATGDPDGGAEGGLEGGATGGPDGGAEGGFEGGAEDGFDG